MTGIMVAVVGNTQNVIYVPGLWIVEIGSAQQSPITASASASGSGQSVSITRNWVGYFLSPSTGSVSLSIQTQNFSEGGGSSASTTGRLWFGVNAFVGDNTQADITTSNNQTVSVNINMVQGVYYPLRIRWNGTYTGGNSGFPFFSSTTGFGSIAFLASGSSNVSGRIFYNSATNGF